MCNYIETAICAIQKNSVDTSVKMVLVLPPATTNSDILSEYSSNWKRMKVVLEEVGGCRFCHPTVSQKTACLGL